jgi:CBS domain containing-hemolysin-like protein
MRSRVDVVAIDERSSYAEVLALIREAGYSRLPVYENDADSVIGILYVKDLLSHLQQQADFAWQELIRTNVLFVPESKKINDLLKEFQKQHLHMAIVVDEYGGTAGIVTLEDILEEVIGDIQDEFDDEPEVLFQKVDDLNYVFDGKTMLNDLYRITGLESPVFDSVKGEADSLAGLLLEMVGELPEFDQELDYEGFRFKIVSVTDRRIERVLMTLPNPSEED